MLESTHRRLSPWLVIPVALALTGLACTEADEASAPANQQAQDNPFACQVLQDPPYDETTPYLGIHGDAGNSDIVECDTADAFEQDWHVLKGHAIAQPNTFSPDSATTYVTAFPNADDPCTLFAIDVETGSVKWCKPLHRSIAGASVEVDQLGNLFVTAEASLYSYTPTGELRWRQALDGQEGEDPNYRSFGLHFTPSGYIATVTLPGIVSILDRESGAILAQFDIATEYGFVAPEPRLPDSVDLLNFFPESSVNDFITAFGSREAANATLGNFLGVSGSFTDNTVGISKRDEIYIQSGGPTQEDGTIVQLHLRQTDDGGLTLEKGWYVLANGGSAASPSISKNGRYLVLSDGAATSTALSQGESEAFVHLVDLEACNTNTDQAPEPELCLPISSQVLTRGAMAGAPPIANDGTIYYWESGLDFTQHYEKSDLFVLESNNEVSQKQLSDGYDWSSVMTVSNNHLIGTISKFTESSEMLLTNPLPATATHQVVLIDRQSLELVWASPLTDDSTSTLTVDREGHLYVTLFGLLNIIAVDERPTLGLVKYNPQGPR